MITSNVFQRTFRIKLDNRVGTGFTIDVEGRQYLATARHIVDEVAQGQSQAVEISYNGAWIPLNFRVAWMSATSSDIALLAPTQQLSPTHPLEASTAGMILGQQMYFCGFSNLFQHDAERINNYYPIPLIRQGILAGLSANGEDQVVVIDGHNVSGFSGGPVVFKPQGSEDYRVAGVISGYQFEKKPIYLENEETDYYHKDNAGLVVAYSLKQGIDYVTDHPTGFKLS